MMNLIKLILFLAPLQAFAGVTPGTIDVRLYDSAGNAINSSGGSLSTATTVSSGSLTCNAGTNLNTSALALDATLSTLSAKFGSIGQQTMAASTPVVIASNQSAIPVTGVFFQATQPVSIAATVAVSGPLTDTQLRASAVPISAASLPLPTGASTSANQTTANSSLSSIDTKLTAPLSTQGSAASGTANSGNPIKIGAVYNSTLSAVTSGNRTDLQTNAFGELVVRHRNKFLNLTGAATTTVKSGTGVLAGISLNNGTASSTITIYDNTAGSGTIIMKLSPGSVSQFGSVYMGIDAEFSTGLTVVTTVASTDVTLFYQ